MKNLNNIFKKNIIIIINIIAVSLVFYFIYDLIALILASNIYSSSNSINIDTIVNYFK
ncbi:MAG: hypothetical protein RLZZ223_498 [Candidatus Parcubacteria bacterium]|jgi:hypothetical protein